MTEIEKRLHDYWEHRAPSYYVPDVFGRRIVAAYLVKLHPQSLIEVGCGNGELFSAYQQIPKVVAVDWSAAMLQRAKERILRHEYKNIRLCHLDIARPFEDQNPEIDEIEPGEVLQFDIALTRTVLMHINPERIEKACENLTQLSDNLVLMEFYDPDHRETRSLAESIQGDPTDKLDWHNFHHEYVQIFKPLGYELIDSYDRPDGLHQLLFHFRRTEVGKPGAPQGP